MRLLIITQAVDTEHPILGFFHRWIEEFAKHCEKIHVICLEEGKHSLPVNVTIHSLGKEEGRDRIAYLHRSYKLIWQLRHEYDSVFVHMNQIYVVLGGLLWRLMGKKIGLWYMHGHVSISLRIAEKLTHKIFTGSPESFRLKSDKVLITGHGIDTIRFAPQTSPKDIDLITVGRITESKNLTTLIDLLKEVRKTNPVSLTIVGGVVTEGERAYETKLKARIESLGLVKAVHFAGRILQAELPTTLNRAKIFVTVAQNGSLDKAVLEAMACGLPVVSMAEGTRSLFLKTRQVRTKDDFVTEVTNILKSDPPAFFVASNVANVKENHSLNNLIALLVKESS
ncbi:glycosyltransferase family 4 protein [Candidatus Kaiserbacteria bacterium]|nr:glycosyltransferase family 4 protein [Candidatus Kaiserbacteria bacterium]MCB9812590.1 glycosyltransferase family 4 protein [Candidatus Nomurabacteria bacterium]